MSDRLTIRGWLYVRSYRALMKIGHRLHWHHAPPLGLTNDAGWPLHRCSWCGLSGFVMPRGWISVNPAAPDASKARASQRATP